MNDKAKRSEAAEGMRDEAPSSSAVVGNSVVQHEHRGHPGASSRIPSRQRYDGVQSQDTGPAATTEPGIQRQASSTSAEDTNQVHAAASRGTSDTGTTLPHASQIQAAFGNHDLSSVEAHVGGSAKEASDAMGAEAFATGNHVAFREPPSLHTAAHEAAHVVQQRDGVNLKGGVGTAGDDYERQADHVADLVVTGKSAEGILGGVSAGTGPGVQRSSVQCQAPPSTSPKAPQVPAAEPHKDEKKDEKKDDNDPGKPGLMTGAGKITDWSVAVSLLMSKWTGENGIGKEHSDAVNNWYQTADKDDPPPAWVGLLETAIVIAVSAATAGVGSLIVAKLVDSETRALTRFAVNAAVKAGKATIGAFAKAHVSTEAATHGKDGLMAYKRSMQQTVGDTVDREAEAMAVNMNGLAARDEQTKWSGLQDLYQALQAAKPTAYAQQYGETLEGWLNMLAMKEFGTVSQIGGEDVSDATGLSLPEKFMLSMAIKDQKLDSLTPDLAKKLELQYGKDWKSQVSQRVDLTAIAEDWGTSSIGTLGFHLSVRGDSPIRPMGVAYAEIEGSKGNNEKTQDWFLRGSGKKIRDFKMPKLLIAEDMYVPHWLTTGYFSVAFGPGNQQWAMQTYGQGIVFTDGSSDNAGRTWLAMYGMGTYGVPGKAAVDAHVGEGVDRLKEEILGSTFAELGITEIST